jgi:integrase
MLKSTKSANARKSGKPRPDFPLFPHATGRWAKKVRGRLHYFGKVADDPHGQKALNLWLDQKDDLLAGRKPRPKTEGLTVADLANSFLNHKRGFLESGELAQRTFDRYYATCFLLNETFGGTRMVADLRPDDFQSLRAKMAKRWGPIALGNEIQIVRSIFRYGYEAELLDRPVRFGPGFKKPSARTIRQTRAANGPRMFTREEIHKTLEAAGVNMRAMVLLGINAALGNTDLGLLPIDAIDLKAGWLDYPRPKTGMPRRIPLWPETVEAIKTVLANRREPKDPQDAPLLFIGQRGENYVGNHRGYRVTQEFDRVLTKAKVNGRSFYDLRRTFQTIAEGAHDLVAVQSIMGHAPANGDMSAIYRQRIDDERLRAVVNHVRAWLYPGRQGAQEREEVTDGNS